MSAQNLIVQFDERQDETKRFSFNITYVKVERGVIVSSPVQIWQRETPGGDIPQALPFIADIELDVRQFRNKEGNIVTQSFIAAFKNAKPVVLEV